jgi:hypothetical protein
MSLDTAAVRALYNRFHSRAIALSRKAEASRNCLDRTRLSAMAAALQWAAQALSLAASHDGGGVPP